MIYTTRQLCSSRIRTINAHVGEVSGGFGLDWQYPDLDPQTFGEFLRDLKRIAGFPQPNLIRLVNNSVNGWGPDWRRLRFSGEDCELYGVRPGDAVERVGRWLESQHVVEKYGLRFIVTISI